MSQWSGKEDEEECDYPCLCAKGRERWKTPEAKNRVYREISD